MLAERAADLGAHRAIILLRGLLESRAQIHRDLCGDEAQLLRMFHNRPSANLAERVDVVTKRRSIPLVPQWLPRFYLLQQQLEDARKVAQIILETDLVDDAPRLVNGADGHNWARRRGLPLISKGVRGTMPGTDPLAALIAKERGRGL